MAGGVDEVQQVLLISCRINTHRNKSARYQTWTGWTSTPRPASQHVVAAHREHWEHWERLFFLVPSPEGVTSCDLLTFSVVQRNGAGLHGDPPDLFILSAVQISQLTRAERGRRPSGGINGRPHESGEQQQRYLPSQSAGYDPVTGHQTVRQRGFTFSRDGRATEGGITQQRITLVAQGSEAPPMFCPST